MASINIRHEQQSAEIPPKPKSFYEFILNHKSTSPLGDPITDIAFFLRQDKYAPASDDALRKYLIIGGRFASKDPELAGEFEFHDPVPEDVVDEAWETYTGIHP